MTDMRYLKVIYIPCSGECGVPLSEKYMQSLNIYKPKPNVNIYDRLNLVDDTDPLIVLHFLGDFNRLENSPQEWKPPLVEILMGEKSGDFPGFVGFHLVFSEKAFNILYPLIEGSVTPLKLSCTSGKNYIAIRVIDIVDCLDYSRAKLTRFDNGRVMDIKAYALQEQLIGDRNIFRLPEINRAFVSQKFKNWVEFHQLEGLIFQKVT
jgi:hypothetical protein